MRYSRVVVYRYQCQYRDDDTDGTCIGDLNDDDASREEESEGEDGGRCRW